MKTQIKIAVVALGVLLAAHANAQNKTTVWSKETDNYYAKFRTDSETDKIRAILAKKTGKNSTLYVTLKDPAGNQIYFKMIGKKQTQKIIDFDMQDVADGIYLLEISDKNFSTKRGFQVGKDVAAHLQIRDNLLVAIN